jgi:hypothetical protein
MRTTITAIMTDGDATDPAVLARLLEGDAAARFVLTDEPYNLRIAGNVTGGPHRESPWRRAK